MKIAIIGSRTLANIEIDAYIPEGVTEIVSGAAAGIDTLARDYAKRKGICMTEFLPEYARYGRAAPIKRNQSIADYADCAIAFWDGKSKGTQSTIRYAEKKKKEINIVLLNAQEIK